MATIVHPAPDHDRRPLIERLRWWIGALRMIPGFSRRMIADIEEAAIEIDLLEERAVRGW